MRYQAIIITVNWASKTTRSEIRMVVGIFSFTKMHLEMSSAKWRPVVSASICSHTGHTAGNVSSRLAIYDVKLELRENFTNHT